MSQITPWERKLIEDAIALPTFEEQWEAIQQIVRAEPDMINVSSLSDWCVANMRNVQEWVARNKAGETVERSVERFCPHCGKKVT